MDIREKALRQLLAARKLEPFITHIRFPFYKNVAPNTRIEFTYPLTALVGANGTNKSSLLRALYGAPENNNLGNFWFSTSIDPIQETGDRRNCFIYGYWHESTDSIVEVLKTRIRKEDDPDYWEPSRPLISYGMTRPPFLPKGVTSAPGRSKTRWNAITKNVEYIDFRAALSAFDKFFYHGELRSKPNNEKNKKDFLRARAKPLKQAIDDGLTSFPYRRSDRIVLGDNTKLSEALVKEISRILGKEYQEISLIRHTFFNCDAFTCLMKASTLSYSEAFAGSGEFAVARIVTSVSRAAPHSLILLDEPEVSLHPGAQERLVDYLLEQIKLHKHQIVISTHSPAIVRRLPKDAVKLLMVDPESGRVLLPSQDALADEAFFHIGEPVPGKVLILVEDVLAKAIVKRALSVSEAALNMFEVEYFPGGSQTLWSRHMPTFAAENRTGILVLLDGDKRPATPMADPTTIPEADDNRLNAEIKRVCGVDMQFPIDGGSNGGDMTQLHAAQRRFMTWARLHVDYLPGQEPESLIWSQMKSDPISASITEPDVKSKFEKLTREELGLQAFEKPTSNDILSTQKRRLATIPLDNDELRSLRDKIMAFKGGNQP